MVMMAEERKGGWLTGAAVTTGGARRAMLGQRKMS
jgi:hypothetical protein